MTIVALGKSLKPPFAMLYNPSSQIARKPHIQHTTTIGHQVDIKHLFNISTESAALAAALEKSAVVFAPTRNH
jgi:hypothetical protein